MCWTAEQGVIGFGFASVSASASSCWRCWIANASSLLFFALLGPRIACHHGASVSVESDRSKASTCARVSGQSVSGCVLSRSQTRTREPFGNRPQIVHELLGSELPDGPHCAYTGAPKKSGPVETSRSDP